MQNRTTLDRDALKREQARDTLMRNMLGGVPHDLSLERMLELNGNAEELHRQLANVFYGDESRVLLALPIIELPTTKQFKTAAFADIRPLAYRGDNFKQICSSHQSEPKQSALKVRPWQLAEQANLVTIFGEILGATPTAENWSSIAVPMAQIYAEIVAAEEAFKAGQEAHLLTNGYVNLFPVPYPDYQLNGEPVVVGCGRDSDGWSLFADPVSNARLWFVGYRVFSAIL